MASYKVVYNKKKMASYKVVYNFKKKSFFFAKS